MSKNKFSLARKLSKDFPWKVLSRLVDDNVNYLPPTFVLEIEKCIRDRNVIKYMELGDSWGPQCINLGHDMSKHSFALIYQIVSFLRKYPFSEGISEADREDTAVHAFLNAEDRCYSFNASRTCHDRSNQTSDQDMAFTYAREFISRVIGDELPSWDVLMKDARHGPGSTFIRSDRGEVTNYFKFADFSHYTCTEKALPYARALLQSDKRWYGAVEDCYRTKQNIQMYEILPSNWLDTVLQVVPGNRITFVPKSAKTHRAIAIEPGLNLVLQLGAEGYIRRRLKRWGVDLDSQEKNQKLAKAGSLDGLTSTLDLAAASDSISLSICKKLLPPEWYYYLNDLRSPVGEVCRTHGNNFSVRYEKMSSMGNGYTFALESLIFSALVYGALKTHGHDWKDQDLAIFGDDLIVPTSIALFLKEMLDCSGFSLNTEKSFFFGEFRESCGADFINGTDVRPVFHKSKVCYIDELYHLYNSIYLWSMKQNGEIQSAEAYVLRMVPPDLRFMGPVLESTNSHLFDGNFASRHGEYRFRTILRKPRKVGDRKTSFLFRKLMARLDGSDKLHHSFLDWRRSEFNIGNVFDVVRRDAYDFSIRSSTVPSWIV